VSREDPRRALPSVDRLLDSEAAAVWGERWGRERLLAALREALSRTRSRLTTEGAGALDPAGAVLALAREILEAGDRPSLEHVLNATGVVLHTNLGRAPLADAAARAAEEAALGYSNLEFDLGTGTRGSRYDHCADLLRELTGAEAALVVNNNAAAVALVVNGLALGREVVVSRGELVEIGGSFRVPEIVERSGARLREVGTTNRTREADYRDAIGPETGLLLKVHPSNYRVEGFVESVALESLVALGREAGVPVAHDLGSGLLRPDLLPDLPSEPAPADSVRAGADVVTWSGDKLLGGPQAGLLVGRAAVLERLRRNPLLRAFRVDKATLAALEATLRLYRDPARASAEIPALRMLAEDASSVRDRADHALRELETPPGVTVQIRDMPSVAGGGSFPGVEISSAGWEVRGVDATELDAACRHGRPPLVGRIHEGAFLLDFRTLLPGEETLARERLMAALGRVVGER